MQFVAVVCLLNPLDYGVKSVDIGCGLDCNSHKSPLIVGDKSLSFTPGLNALMMHCCLQEEPVCCDVIVAEGWSRWGM